MRLRMPIPLVPLALLALGAVVNAAEPVRYTLRFPAPQTHYVEVEAEIPAEGLDHVELMMPVWTPGSYLVREYARHVEGLTASKPDGTPLAAEKSAKNRWKIAAGGVPRVVVRYRVYGREMSVQTNWIDGSFALLNGAATFLTPVEKGPRPHEVTVVPPQAWAQSFCGLPDLEAGVPHRFIAQDYDALVDSPIYVGNPVVDRFEIDGKPHYIVTEGGSKLWDYGRAAADVATIVKAQRDFWGSLPYDKYLFFNMLTETGGGLEHRNSTVLMASRWATRRRADYLGWLRLVSHEFFHTWNVKRLRPIELGPFDYEREVVTRSLWMAEGLTSYYGDLLLRRAGLCTEAEYLAGDISPVGPDADKPKNDIQRLQETPGRAVQPLESASADAWIKFYRRDENTPNTGISYYIKGSIVGFLLDAEIRRSTDGAKSLDDAMRLAYDRYSGATGFTPAQFRAVAAEVAGTDLSGFFRRALETTDELDYAEAIKWFGLKFSAGDDAKDKKDETPKPDKAWLGLTTTPEGGRLTVSGVKRETPGFLAGFNVGDEILAIGDDRILAEQWARRMEQYRPDDSAPVLIARRGRLMTLNATFGREPKPEFKLIPDPMASDTQKAHLRAWLGN